MQDRQYTIAVDAMGGDFYPEAPVLGSLLALNMWPDNRLIIKLIGDETAVKNEIQRIHSSKRYKFRKKYRYGDGRITVVHAAEIIGMEDKPAESVRKKPESSIHVGLNLLRSGQADAFISAGNSGAIMAVALVKLGRVEGVDRPAIASVFPTAKGPCIVLDVGANAECTPQNLFQFGIMGSLYAQHVLGIDNPSVGLMSVGEEDEKGDSVIIAANKMLRHSHAADKVNFYGNIEGRDLLPGKVQVVVCNGLLGNVILKFAESIIPALGTALSDKVRTGGLDQKIFAGFAKISLKPTFASVKRDFNYEEYGGAPLLGIRFPVIISHGSSSQKAIANAILKSCLAVQYDIAGKIRQSFQALA